MNPRHDVAAPQQSASESVKPGHKPTPNKDTKLKTSFRPVKEGDDENATSALWPRLEVGRQSPPHYPCRRTEQWQIEYRVEGLGFRV